MSSNFNYDPLRQQVSPGLTVTSVWNTKEYEDGVKMMIPEILAFFVDDCLFSYRTPTGPDALFRVKAPKIDRAGKVVGGSIQLETLSDAVEWDSSETYSQWRYFAYNSLLKNLNNNNQRKPFAEANQAISKLLAKPTSDASTTSPVHTYKPDFDSSGILGGFPIGHLSVLGCSGEMTSANDLKTSLVDITGNQDMMQKLKSIIAMMLEERHRPPREELIAQANEQLASLGFPTSFQVPTALMGKSSSMSAEPPKTVLEMLEDYDPDIHDSPTVLVEEKWGMSFLTSDEFQDDEQDLLCGEKSALTDRLSLEIASLPLTIPQTKIEWVMQELEDTDSTSTSDPGAYSQETVAISVPKPGDKLQFYWSSYGEAIYARMIR